MKPANEIKARAGPHQHFENLEDEMLIRQRWMESDRLEREQRRVGKTVNRRAGPSLLEKCLHLAKAKNSEWLEEEVIEVGPLPAMGEESEDEDEACGDEDEASPLARNKDAIDEELDEVI
jgi:hypothetical protein